MKKLIFLLLTLMISVGMVFAMASPVHPPGVDYLEITMAENDIQENIVTQPTVLAAVVLTTTPSSFQAIMVYNDNDQAISLHSGLQTNIWKPMISKEPVDYYLRC